MNRSRWTGRDAGVSDVIGFILITAIALVSVTLVLLGGQPTLERLQSGQEVQAIAASMNSLDHEVESLITGAPASTTPTWRVSMGRGSVNLNDTGHVWTVAVDLGSGINLEFGSLDDGDNLVCVKDNGSTSISDPQVRAFLHTASSVSQITGASVASGCGAGEWQLDVVSNIAGNSTEVRFHDGSPSSTPVLHRVYFIDSGAVIWSEGGQEVAYENTAVILRQPNGLVMDQRPSLRPPQETGSSSSPKSSIFVRVIKLNGTLGLSGQTSATVLLDSDGNHIRLANGDVERVQIYPPPRYREAWTRMLDDDTLGYPYTVSQNSLANPATRAFCDKAAATSCDPDGTALDELAISIVETNVRLEVD